VVPEELRPDDVFLHVLWATDDTVQTMFPVETIEAAGRAGARFSADGIDVTATFAMTGEIGGHLRLVRNGEAICDQPLTQGVEDSYAKWTSDPRFEAWRTNRYMGAVIGEGG
jgi:hypothetical protein